MNPPAVGEDWTEARCKNSTRTRGPCCFCGRAILPSQGFAAYMGRRIAHYDCAPGLGVPVVRP